MEITPGLNLDIMWNAPRKGNAYLYAQEYLILLMYDWYPANTPNILLFISRDPPVSSP